MTLSSRTNKLTPGGATPGQRNKDGREPAAECPPDSRSSERKGGLDARSGGPNPRTRLFGRPAPADIGTLIEHARGGHRVNHAGCRACALRGFR